MKNKENLFIDGINQKQRAAYHELFREFYQSLVMFAMRYIKEQGEAEDIVQDVFVAVWEKKEKFLSYQSFRVFLYNSVRNTCLNRIKHRKVEEKYIDYSLKNDNKTDETDYELIEEEVYRRLFQTIDELPARCREIFLLHLDGKKNEEIASLLHLSILTVKTQKKRAMYVIRERLGHLGIFLLLLFADWNKMQGG